MKTNVIFGFFLLCLLQIGCQKNDAQNSAEALKSSSAQEQTGCFKGVLVKKGICGQRVVQFISANKAGVAHATTWKDESTGKTYENVFNVENYCAFPSSVNEGDEIYFKLTTDPANTCAVCQAFTPVPQQKNCIVVGGECGAPASGR